MKISGQHIFIILFGLFYFIYTLSFALHFHKTANRLFNKKQKLINAFLIWIVPFIWIMIVKAIMKPSTKTLGKKLSDTTNAFYNYGWVNSWIFFLHGVGNESHSGNEIDGHHGNDYPNYSEHGSGGQNDGDSTRD